MLIEITYNVTDVFMSTTETPVYVEISFEQPGGSSAVWGSITGTLSNQTDLQNALNLKVPYTGATTNVNLGEYELKAGQVTLDTSPTGTAAVGTIRWNDTTGTSETTLKGGNVILKNGVDLVARVVNKVTPNTTLTKAAYQAVRVSGAQGQRLAIELAQANNDANSADTIGLVTETIATNQEGFIMTVGQLEGINTTGSLQGETWADGDVLYLSPTTPGALTNIKPTAVTGHIVVVGYVEYAHVNNGKIYVKVMNGWELDELHNVSIVSPANNQGIFYNSTSLLWENKTIDTALGFTPVPTTRNITINGVTYDLSADRTYTISTGISGSGASGQVTYWTGASAVSGSNNLYFDPTNIRFAVGTNTPQATFAVRFPVTGNKHIEFSNIGGVNYLESLDRTSGNAPLHLYTAQGNSYIAFTAGLGAEKMRLHGTGNLVLGGTVSTDNGQRLQVIGDTLLRGSGATSATTALTVQDSASSDMLRVRSDSRILIGGASTTAAPSIYAYSGITGNRSLRVGIQSAGSLTPIPAFNINQENDYTYTTGTGEFTTITANFLPTSGTGTLASLVLRNTINQTGGANGITRGLYVNPTLTAAADWRSIEWSNNSGWGLYGAGTADNYIRGSLGINSTALTGYSLRVDKNLTGATTTFGVYSGGQINSDVTGTAFLFRTRAFTQASSFTLSTLIHYSASNSGLGTGSAITTQYGFIAEADLTQATNNYGFYGGIASGTGRWNLYMAGTANNYVAGNFSVGTTSVTNWLNIAASTTAKAHINLAAGSTPTAPANGDIWFDGTDIKMRIGGVTKTFTLI